MVRRKKRDGVGERTRKMEEEEKMKGADEGKGAQAVYLI
jgi:hypothetical protein